MPPTLADKITWRFLPGYYTSKLTEFALRTQRRRAMVTSVVTKLIPRSRDTPPNGTAGFGVDVAAGVRAMESDGYAKFGRLLDERQIAELVAFARAHDCVDPWGATSARFRYADAPAGCHTAQLIREELLDCPLIVHLANDAGMLAVARRYLGAMPTLSNITMWWSLPGRPAAKEAQLFHRDRDDLRFCKLFYYLTDVDMGSGPHVYVRGSPREWTLTEPRRFEDAEVERAFGREQIQHFCGQRGTAFLVDTWGIHKGLLPVERERLLLQVEYSLLPIGRERYDRDRKLPGPGEFDPYVNRLFVDGASRFSRLPFGLKI